MGRGGQSDSLDLDGFHILLNKAGVCLIDLMPSTTSEIPRFQDRIFPIVTTPAFDSFFVKVSGLQNAGFVIVVERILGGTQCQKVQFLS